MSSLARPPAHKAHLNLIPGAPNQLFALKSLLHLLFVFLPHLFVTLPSSILWNHVFARWSKNGIVRQIGRSVFADYIVSLTRYVLSHLDIPGSRLLFNRTTAYDNIVKTHFAGYRDWINYVTVKGVSGRWICPPGSVRSEDEVCLFYVHGGGFVLDTGGNGQIWALELAKEMNLRRKVNFSIFLIDYELAPEFKYPSQLIEMLAAYHHLVNDLGISADKIVLSGDSAGGNLAAAFLLHLARPHPAISVPADIYGPTPPKPGAALLLSPFIKLVSHTASRRTNAKFDYIDNASSFTAALGYIGAKHPTPHAERSYNPLHLISSSPYPSVPRNLIKITKPYTVDGEGLELFNSPYVNPSVCMDLDWWNEAMPGGGRTMITVGGKEIFHDEVVEWIAVLEKANVKPITLLKTLGAHDSYLFDYVIPGVWRTKSKGKDASFDFGVRSMSDFLQEIDIAARRKFWEEKRAREVVELVEEKEVVEKVEEEVVDSLVGSKFEMVEEPVLVEAAVVAAPVAVDAPVEVVEAPVEVKAKKSKGKKI